MKKVVCISGILTVLFLTLILTGWADADSDMNTALRRGNEQYASVKYEDALASYETGLETNPENQALNFNAAQAAYLIGDYEKAAGYYESAGDCIDKYLNAGNIFFRAGDALEDVNQKTQCYAEALQVYREGVIKYPQNVPLKYNYEAVKALVDELLEEAEQEGGSGEQGEEQSEDESGGQSDSQSEGEEGAETQEQDSEGAEDTDGEQDGDSEKAENSETAQNEDNEGEDQGSYSEDETEYDPDQEAIARILEMLESQEEESLKNNQGVAPGKDDTNGW